MAIDWNAVATITSPVVALFVGVFVNRWFENRPRLLVYYGHVNTHPLSVPPDDEPLQVHTHSVIVRNSGRLPATNVRLMHRELPNVHVNPSLPYKTEFTTGGSQDLVIERLLPNQEVTVSYLYYAPLIAANVNTGVVSDQGMATFIPVLLSKVVTPAFRRTMWTLAGIGGITLVYLLYAFLTWLLQRLG